VRVSMGERLRTIAVNIVRRSGDAVCECPSVKEGYRWTFQESIFSQNIKILIFNALGVMLTVSSS